MEERRLHPRAKLSCKISVMSDYRILVFNVDVENIGEGGLRVLLKEKLNVGSALDIEILPPDKGEPIRGKGQVIWANEKKGDDKDALVDTGIKFKNLKDVDKQRINSW